MFDTAAEHDPLPRQLRQTTGPLSSPWKRPRLGAAALLLFMLGCSGCGSASAKPITRNTEGILPSPLPPIQVDDKILKAKSTVLYGRVVVDGKPAKKGSLLVMAVSVDAMMKDPAVARSVGRPQRKNAMEPPKPNTPAEPATKPTYSSGVIRDDGLYVIKGLPPGEYKLACRFGDSFKGKADRVRMARYSDPVGSAIEVTIMEGQTMQDVVMNLAAPAN